MKSNKLIINRLVKSDKQTTGVGLVISGYSDIEYTFKTLELPWKNNEKRVSCIPTGTYKVVRRWSEKYKDHFLILDVDNRSYILIHQGNYHTQILGCILVGKDHVDINQDGYKDVTSSVATLKKLLELMEDEFTLIIN